MNDPDPAAADQGAGRDPGIQSVDRAIAALRFLARRGEATAAELAAELDVHRSTAFRLLTSLEAGDLVEQLADRSRYRLGLGLVTLAGSVAARIDVVTVGRAVCTELAQTLGETVNLAVRDGAWAINVEQALGPAAVGALNWIGKLTPLHATSSGKVLLASLGHEDLARVLAEAEPEAFTERTLTGDALLADLDAVRARGHALTNEEYEAGLVAAAAPVRDRFGVVVAALSVSGPTFRLDPTTIESMVPKLVAAADEISARLGLVVD